METEPRTSVPRRCEILGTLPCDRTFLRGNTFRIAPPRGFFNVASHSPQRQRALYTGNTGSRLLAFKQRFISLWIYIPWYSSPFLHCGPAVFFIISFSWLATDKHVLFLSCHLCCGFWVHSVHVYFVIYLFLVRIFLGILQYYIFCGREFVLK